MRRIFPFRRRDNSQAATPPGSLPVLAEHYQLALKLVNEYRMQGDCPLLALGTNGSPQRHADDCLAVGLASQWSRDGLKPYMRYSLAGGCQVNVSFSWQNTVTGSRGLTDMAGEIEEGVRALFGTVGQRRMLLDRMLRQLSIGIAWNRNHFVLYLTLEGDWVEYDQLPKIEGSLLRFSGRVKSGVRLNRAEDLAVDVWYDPPPQPLTEGQLLRVNAYDYGMIAGSLRQPPSEGYQWTENRGSTVVERLTQPEDIPANAPAPRDFDERQEVMQRAYYANEKPRRLEVTYPLVTCQEWRVSRDGFSVAADMGEIVGAKGAGVYTLALWAPLERRDGRLIISRYSMFVGMGDLSMVEDRR